VALSGKKAPPFSLCPLDLLSQNYEVLERPAKAILKMAMSPQTEQETRRLYTLCNWLRKSVVHKLAALQEKLDPTGVFQADPNDKDFLTAMTLRDCSVFLQIPDEIRPYEPDNGLVGQLGDLDLKSSLKAEYWKSVEAPLIIEGWYMGTEAEELSQPLDCGLSLGHV
jgi:inositol-pentakisphosphate 2-kinase